MSTPFSFYMPSGDRTTIANARLDDISPEALGAKLERLYRFQGMPGSLSVAQHSMLCFLLASGSRETAAAVLVHDVAEAFTGDIHPLFKSDDVREKERAVEASLVRRGWRIEHTVETHRIDKEALKYEIDLIWKHRHVALTSAVNSAAPGDWAKLVRRMEAFVP